LYYAVIASVIAGVFTTLLTIVVTLVFAGTFHAASQQIAVDRLTVKTALALAGLLLLNFTLCLLVGFLAGAVFYLMTFLASLIASYPGNLTVNGTTMMTDSLVISCLLLCLWSIGGGLVSLFGTWVATVKHPHYLRFGE
jgi:hypothetical protein